MAPHTIIKKRYMEVGQVFHWATKEHYQMMFTGEAVGRHSRTEKVLPRLVSEKKLVAVPWGARLVYSVPRRTRGKASFSRYKIEHGLACTECLVRIWLSRLAGQIVSEKAFTKFDAVADWGIVYPHQILLLFEFASHDNFSRKKLIRDKISRYMASIDAMKAAFGCKKAIVLYVIDDERSKIRQFILEAQVSEEFFFSDYETFKRVPLGGQLTAEIYIWQNGKEYPLTTND